MLSNGLLIMPKINYLPQMNFVLILNYGKINKKIEDFELKYIANNPQDGTGVIICEAQNSSTLMSL